MLDKTKQVIALPMWSIEKRGRYWHIVKPAFFTEPEIDKGPFSTITSAALMIARELVKEASKQQPITDRLPPRRHGDIVSGARQASWRGISGTPLRRLIRRDART